MDFTEIKKNLETNGFTVSEFATAAEASAYLNEKIDGTTVGFGGSMTLAEMGLFESLGAHNTVWWHQNAREHNTGHTVDETRVLANAAPVYLMSANGIAESGEIVNIDGTGNRIASMMYGHEKVYFVVGRNKIEKDYDAALYRARNVAAPLNAKRLNAATPCAVKGDRCYDCKSPGRICRGLSVLWRCPTGADYEVVLIDEDLGL